LLITKRCVLLPIQQSDYEDVTRLYQNEDVRKYLGGIKQEESIRAIMASMIEPSLNSFYFVVREKHTHNFIGLLSLDTHHDGVSTEVSYQFLPRWWGSGYATEVVNEVINFAFEELNNPVLVAETQTANRASCRLLERLGMQIQETIERFGAEQAIYRLEKVKSLGFVDKSSRENSEK
jgi:[ribosomal protein S5]-alanine N-acetyltransferase